MLTRSRLPLAFSLPLLQSDPPPGGGGNPPATPPADPPKVEFSAEQQTKVNDLIAAARKKAEEDTAAKLKADADEAKRKADADAQRKRDADAGEFDKVKQSLESERDTAKASLDAATAELETLRAYVNADIAGITKQVTDLKDDPTAKTLLGFHPGDDAGTVPLLAWAAKAKERLPEIVATTTAGPGNGANPKPAGNEKPNIRESLRGIRYT